MRNNKSIYIALLCEVEETVAAMAAMSIEPAGGAAGAPVDTMDTCPMEVGEISYSLDLLSILLGRLLLNLFIPTPWKLDDKL